MFVRAATQFACRAKVLDDRECKWLIRATHNSDEVRNPLAKGRSVRTTARRLVIGYPKEDSSVDLRPGKRARSRPSVSFPEG